MFNIEKLITSKAFFLGNVIANIMFLIFNLLAIGVEKLLALKIAILILFLYWVSLVIIYKAVRHRHLSIEP